MTSMADPVRQNQLSSIPPASSVQVFPEHPHHILINGGYGNYSYINRLSSSNVVVSNNSSSSNNGDHDSEHQLLLKRVRSSASAGLTLGIQHHHHHINYTTNYSISTINTNNSGSGSGSGSSSENSTHLGRKRGNPSCHAGQKYPQEDEEQDEAAGSWLQLGIGSTQPPADNNYEYRDMMNKVRPSTSYGSISGFSHGGLDLHLAPASTAAFDYPQYHHHHHHHHTKLISTSSLLAPPPSLFGSVVDPSASEFRIIHPPPRRPNSGVWFMLQPSQHQEREPFLPHLSKSFLRIKDGRMTVRLVMKYVANKLGLDSEFEVEIKCRGQKLVPILTLEHVRDRIWSPSPSREIIFDAANFTSMPSHSTPHVMILHYGRI